MTIAIHNSANSYSIHWIDYCESMQIKFRLVNCYHTDIIDQLAGCDGLLWHHHHHHPKDMLFAKQLLFSLEQSGMRVFPDFNTGWHFDDKVGQKYLLERAGIAVPKSYVFYTREDAMRWLRTATFPKVFKLRSGAGSANVEVVGNKIDALKKIKRAFGSGFARYRGYDKLKERFRKYKLGKSDIKDLAKGIFRLFISPAYSQIGGRERGYIYFQDFIPGNLHDIRVVVIGDKAYAIKRITRANDFRASGSGEVLYEKDCFDEGTIKLSFEIAGKLKTQCLALDYVYEGGIPFVLEISYGFSMEVYVDCPGYWDSNLKWHEGKFNPYGWMIDDLIKSI